MCHIGPPGWFKGRLEKVEIYNNDIVLHRQGHPNSSNNGKRKEITQFSEKARQRLAFIASNTSVNFRSFLTLTYPAEYPADGKVVKKHLKNFRKRLKRIIGHYEYLWFFEFQKRGAPHIHLLLDYQLPGPLIVVQSRQNKTKYLTNWNLHEQCAQAWYEIVGSQNEKHRKAGIRLEQAKKPNGLKRYAIKYATKMQQKIVPPTFRNIGRFYGFSAAVKPKKIANMNTTELGLKLKLWRHNWKYCEAGEPLPKVLYNAADKICEKV